MACAEALRWVPNQGSEGRSWLGLRGKGEASEARNLSESQMLQVSNSMVTQISPGS